MIENETIFWVCALCGSTLFAIQLLLNFLGLIEDSDAASSLQFKWLSKQALVGFLMMFGWSGLTCYKELDLSLAASVTIALASGLITIFFLGLIFKGARMLRSTGTIFSLDEAIGKEAVTYQKIPKDGIGKISLALQGFTHEIDAVSLGEEIPSFTSVRILKKSDDKTVIVVPK